MRVLNAKNDAEEAAIVARADQFGAVTISTNMAGRGTDIRLGGDRVVALGGLRDRHESAREPASDLQQGTRRPAGIRASLAWS